MSGRRNAIGLTLTPCYNHHQQAVEHLAISLEEVVAEATSPGAVLKSLCITKHKLRVHRDSCNGLP